jgi:hypothetical protein
VVIFWFCGFGLAWLGLVWFGFPDQENKQVPQQHRMQSRHEIHMPKAAVNKNVFDKYGEKCIGGRFANKFRISQICKFAELQNMLY